MIRLPLAGDRGSASAEFAVALPAAVIVVALGVGALAAASTQVRLQDAAADAARLAARGEPDRVSSVVSTAVGGASASLDESGELVCVTAQRDAAFGPFSIALEARSCALAGGL
ncbi:TadE family type IV pilus minor pilin [Microbacterium indicum]|uniref:TadE family type IV pilus minor pilin n=1 Tax=Microbacterium indicum TaxID=358100 RepID=UPI00040DA2A5|nr:TadE family type IV pilus minor pilin [Microbacterium indicum]